MAPTVDISSCKFSFAEEKAKKRRVKKEDGF